jgi:hypothetical protein
MKRLLSVGLTLGMLASVPAFADNHMDKDKMMNKAQPHDMVVMKLKHPDGSKAKVLMKRKDAVKFHKAKGVEALMLGEVVER